MEQPSIKQAIDLIADNETRKILSDYVKALEDRVKLASKDDLTGLLNRKGFSENTQCLIEEYERRYREYEMQLRKDKPKGVACLFIDLDRFKLYNDTYGHLAGDELLEKSARTFQATLRNYDTLFLGRWGGDEFVSAVSNTSLEEGLKVGERIRKDFNTQHEIWIRHQETKKYRVTLSIGLAHFNHNARGFYDLLDKADKAMYRAKEEGDRVKQYEIDV